MAKSGLGYPFVCHVGDFFGEQAFYNREAYRLELEMCASWLATEEAPVVVDVGANVGFWSTQLAQMIAGVRPFIYALEPVPHTYCRLVESIETLGLTSRIAPLAAAILNGPRTVRLSHNPKQTGFAQVSETKINLRAGDRLVQSLALSLDELVDSLGIAPSLVKVDVEGSEVAVLQGGHDLLARPNPPALMLEFNPLTLRETGALRSTFESLLSRYAIYYVDDFEGQKKEFGAPVNTLDDLDTVCNLLAVPDTEVAKIRFQQAVRATKSRLAISR